MLLMTIENLFRFWFDVDMDTPVAPFANMD